METKEMAIVIVSVILLLGVIIALKLKNRNIRFVLRTLKEEQRPAAAGPAKRSSGGTGSYTSVESLQEGDTLAEDVHDNANKMVLLEAGTELNKKQIEKLKNWNIKKVFLK